MTSQDELQTGKNNIRPNRGEMIVVCSAKGGIGRTILTVNIAAALYKKNISVGVVDGDFQFGDVSLAMDLQSTFTMKEVIEGIETLDEYSLPGYLCRHESGVKVLPAPERPEYADLMSKEKVNKVMEHMLQIFDYTLVDTGVGFNEHTLNFVEKADQILVVTNLEMATLKNTKLMLETFEILGLKEKIRIVINRATMESVIQATDAAQILGDENPFYIPNDFQVCSQSLNIGIPFVMNQGKTEVAKSVFKMAEQITSRREIGLLKANKPSFLSKLISRKQKKVGIHE
ncbi:AAA family ATPase [Neobacillus sp. D3-1R]|uniref:AAA family ATPase n=1 Tax=Neobacillus sp. D3-1R TaxID=3445778 RepID=UPI003FA02ED3